jgi:outer membrane immunogenic protein
MMTRILLSAVALSVLLCASARAADVPARVYKAPVAPPPVSYHTWSGFYVGLHLGYARSRLEAGAIITEAGEPNEIATGHDDGYLAGGQLGFNWQVRQWVLGLETDLGYLGVKHQVTFPPGGVPEDAFQTKFGFYGTVTGRLGWTFDRLLAYAKGGFVFANVRHTATDFEDPAESLSFRKTRTGWTAGGGLEYAFAPNWSAKLEYLYMDFGDVTRPNPVDAEEAILFDNRMHTVKVGVNYRFGPLGPR